MDEQELREALQTCRREGLPWQVLGGGSNLLVEDGPLPFAVIHVCAPGLSVIQQSAPHRVRVGAGTTTARLLGYCKEHGLGGLEFLAGIPGTVGGAVAGNAGAWQSQVSDHLATVCVIGPEAGTRVLSRSQLDFGYRRSPLAGHIIVEAEFLLEPRSPALIGRQMARYARARAERHPLGVPSAGCIFKNPPTASAGKLLDMCGLKGRQVGSAQVSVRHANFIVNRGDATAQHVLNLIETMKHAVMQQFGIKLELEVRHWRAQSRVA